MTMTHKSPRVSPTLEDLLRRRPRGRPIAPDTARQGMDAIGHPRRSPAALKAAILNLLANGPLMKWQIREALHEPETYVLAHLQDLRRAGQVKVIGKILDQRKWALTTWSEPAKTPPPPVSTTKPHVPATLGDHKPTLFPGKPKPPADSWWTKGESREDFDRRAADRGREAGWIGRSLREP